MYWSVAVLLGAALIGAEPPPGPITVPDECQVQCAALEGYYNSFDRFCWHQEFWCPPTIAHGHNREAWTRGGAGHRCADAEGYFFTECAMSARASESGTVIEWREVELSSGTWRITCDPDAQSKGLLVPPRDFPMWGAPLARWVGYFNEYGAWRESPRLGTLLRHAGESRPLSPEGYGKWLGVGFKNLMPRSAVELQVWLDPDHDLAPRITRFVDVLTGRVVEEFIVVEYQQINGVWVPHIGVSMMRSAVAPEVGEAPIPESLRDDIDRSIALDGLPVELRGNMKLRAILTDLLRPRLLRDGVSWEVPTGCSGEDGQLITPGIHVFTEVDLSPNTQFEDVFREAVRADHEFLTSDHLTLRRDDALQEWRKRTGLEGR